MPSNVHAHVTRCEFGWRHRQFEMHHKMLMMFRLLRPLEFVAINILGPLTRMKRGNWSILVMTDRCTKLKGTIPVSKITATNVGNVVIEYRIMPSGISDIICKENSKQFTYKFLCCTMCTFENEAGNNNRISSSKQWTGWTAYHKLATSL